MITKIALILALCAHPKPTEVQAKLAELRKDNPTAQVSVRIDKKAQCVNGKPIYGQEAKVLSNL